MKRVLLWIVVCGVSVAACATRTSLPKAVRSGTPPNVRIGLAVRVPDLMLQLDGRFAIRTRERAAFETDGAILRLVSRNAHVVGYLADAREVQGRRWLKLEPLEPHAVVVFEGNVYPGAFEVRTADGMLTLVNELPLEEYLRGVVPWEIGWHDGDRAGALEAQAIAARTYACKRFGQYPDEGFDLVAGVQDQVYRGTTRTDSTADAAILRTRGLVLAAADGLADAYYSSTCGGHTSRIDNVWAQRPSRTYLQGRRDAPIDTAQSYCVTSRHFRWTETWSVDELQQMLPETIPLALELDDHVAVGRLLDLQPGPREPSGRLQYVDFTTTSGVFRVVGDRIRWALRPRERSILRSTMVALEVERRDGRIVRLVARGGGNGHGVGMCQMGALEMARRGRSHGEILSHYYPGTLLVRLY